MKIEVIPRLFIISIRAGRNSSSFSRRGNRVTGFLVSFGVWIVQVGVERKRARLQLEKDIASLRETLRYAEIKSNVTMIDSAVISEPNAVKTIISLIKKEPLDIWLESNGRWADFVHILSQISKSHSKFIQAAEQLDLNLRLFIRNYNASKNIMDFFDDGS